MKECFLDERQWILSVDPSSYLFFCCNLIYFKSWFFDGRRWAISVIKWGLNTQFFLCISVLSDFFCLSIPIVKSVWVTEHSKMPKLERAFKWREIVYARLTLTDLANVKQLSWATRATIIIGDAHFQVAVERRYLKKKMFHLVSCSARVHKFWRFPGSCFHNDRYNLDILDSLNCIA